VTFLLAISAAVLGQNGDHDKMMEKMIPHQKEMDRNFHHPRFTSGNQHGIMNRPSMMGSNHHNKPKNPKKPSMPYNHKLSMNKPVHKLGQTMMGKKMMSAPKMDVKPMKMVVKMPSKPMMTM